LPDTALVGQNADLLGHWACYVQSACRHRAVLQDRARYVQAIAAGVVEALTAGGAGVLSANRARVRVQQGGGVEHRGQDRADSGRARCDRPARPGTDISGGAASNSTPGSLGHRLTGQVMRYVAVLDGQWVALVGFGSAALPVMRVQLSVEPADLVPSDRPDPQISDPAGHGTGLSAHQHERQSPRVVAARSHDQLTCRGPGPSAGVACGMVATDPAADVVWAYSLVDSHSTIGNDCRRATMMTASRR
jgi:hypothetical protein